MDVEAGTDMASAGDAGKIRFAMDKDEPGLNGGGLKYPKSGAEFYDHMLFNANLTLMRNKGWRYWSRIRVRDEVYYMLQKVENLIKRNYKMHYAVKQNLEGDRTFLKEDVELAQQKMTALVGEVKAVAEKIGAGLTELRKAEEEEQRRLEHYKGHYDRDLRRIHAVLTNQTIELEKERHDALRKAYDKQLAKMQEDVDGILAEDRAQMVKNNEESKQKIQAIQDQLDRDTKDMSDLQHSIFVNVEAAKVKEVADMDNVTAVHSSLQTYLHNMRSSLDESLTKQKAIEELAKSNQEALAAVTTKVDTAAFKLSMLEKKQASDHEQVDDKLKSLVETSDGLQSSLTTQTDAVSSLKETVDKFAQESPEFKKTVEGDHAALKSTIDDLMNEIKKADKLKQDISDLEISMNTQINDISSKIDDLGGTQSTLATSLGQQQTDMATLKTRIATLEESAKSSSDEAKSDHDRVSAVVTEMQSKLSTLLDLKTRIEELQASVSTNVEDLQGKITDAEATHNSTRDSLLESMENLKGELAAQALQEQNAESNTSVAIAQFQTELNDLNSFKTDSEKSAAELVKKLTDTTESLSILDSKFSGQHTDLDSKISSLQASVDKVPTKVEFEKTIQDAMDKAKKAQKKLDEVGTEISNIRADQTVDDGRILSLNGKADEQSNTNDKNWKDILDMIQEEGDLFSKISKKLKDEELRKDVDTVFGRTSQPTAA
eukprot:Tamp_06896.p1 GENE.Tamp_06896~~Tamp_06896.p1  ORF type:complete len:839 (+),score=317.91 Tamp_06896:369-2519(+)